MKSNLTNYNQASTLAQISDSIAPKLLLNMKISGLRIKRIVVRIAKTIIADPSKRFAAIIEFFFKISLLPEHLWVNPLIKYLI